MPEYIDNDGIKHEYLEEAELLEIANKIRKMGGADVLDAFMPSKPNWPSRCLIANALNFGCTVAGFPYRIPSQHQNHTNPVENRWTMYLPNDEIAKMVSKEMDWYRVGSYVLLPVKVGNTARAFDDEIGWTRKYNKHLLNLED